MATINLRDVNKYFDATQVINSVNLGIEAGEFCVFLGPSGCGKSTLLRMIAGLEEISSGEVFIDGNCVNEVPPAKREVAMVFQSYALYPHMSIYENMGFSLKLAKVAPAEIDRSVRATARLLQLEDYLDRKPKALSGGQRQRVAIGRALVRNPKVFLFDEPLSNLDAALRVQMRQELGRLHAEVSSSIIYVTHDQVEAMTLADKIVLLNSGAAVREQGSIAQIGTPEDLYLRPRTLFVAGFIGSPKMNLLAAELLSSSAKSCKVKLAEGTELELPISAGELQAGAQLTVGIRPEHVQLSDSGIGGELVDSEYLGECNYLYLQTKADANQQLIVKAPPSRDYHRNQRLHIQLTPQACHLFNPQGLAL